MNSRRRVLHVLNSGDIGGVERLVMDLAVVQKADPALDVALLFLQSAAGDFGPEIESLGVPLHYLRLSSGRDLSPAKYRRAVNILRGFDVIHVHVFNPLLAAAAVRAGRPVIYTMHGVLGHGRSMRLSDRVNDWLLGRFLNRHVALVTHNSRATEVLARERYGLGGVPSDVIYNGVALARLAARAPGVDPDTAARIAGRFVVGTSTRFAGFKRIDRLIDGFALFARAHPEARLLLVGDGVLRPELEARVAAAGIAGQTLFTGFRPNVRAYQEAMSVCVFPSVAEPFGLVSVEAFALGKPVIVFADGGGMVEVIAPCAAADVVADVPGLAARLAHYAAHAGEITAGAAVRRAYAERFDISHTASEFRRRYLARGPCVE
jgi:glycosyltransferase involved in cell wall biosynthesis